MQLRFVKIRLTGIRARFIYFFLFAILPDYNESKTCPMLRFSLTNKPIFVRTLSAKAIKIDDIFI